MVFNVYFLFVLVLAVGSVSCGPAFYHESDQRPLTTLSELSSRLAARAQHDPEQRLPIPTPQDLEAIKKVAQILITLGQQVIPAIIGEPSAQVNNCDTPGAEDIPKDPVNTNV